MAKEILGSEEYIGNNLDKMFASLTLMQKRMQKLKELAHDVRKIEYFEKIAKLEERFEAALEKITNSSLTFEQIFANNLEQIHKGLALEQIRIEELQQKTVKSQAYEYAVILRAMKDEVGDLQQFVKQI